MSYFLSSEYIERLSKSRKKNSVKAIDKGIKRIYVRGLKVDKFDINIIQHRYKDICDFIDSIKYISSRKKLYGNIYNIIDRDSIAGKYIQKKYKFTQFAYTRERNFSIIDKEFISLENVYNKEFINTKLYNTKMFLKYLYSHLPAFRIQDYYTIIVMDKNTDEKINYYNMISGELYLKNYKNIDSLGIRKIKYPKDIIWQFQRYIDMQGLFPGDHLFTNSLNNSMESKDFGLLLKRTIGINNSMIRKIYIAEMIEYLKKLYNGKELIKWRLKIADIMGHSLNTQFSLYSDFDISKVDNYSSDKYMEELYNILSNISVDIILDF